ncbi:hypothetical protein Tco_1026091, partial [Tanacetum coccineum]
MDQNSVHMVATSKVPMLKPSEYELWRMRMEQYIQMIDYSLWEVIKNGNAPPITKVIEGVKTIIAPTTNEEKARDDEDDGAEADMNNLDTTIQLYVILLGKAKKSARLMMEKLFGIELELILSTVKAKTIIGEVQLHALVDGKKVIITEVIVRRDLQLEDEEGVDCLPNSTIFEQLTLMGSKTTAWNEFSSTMASAIICLATNQKFNFSKYIFEKLGEGSAMPTDPQHTPTFIQSSPPPQKTQKPRKPKRKDTQVPQPSGPTDIVTDEAVHKELGDSLVRAATTASSLEAEHDSGNIAKTRSKATPNESSSLGTTSGGGPRCQETIGDTIAQTRVLDLEKTKTTQANEIASLKRRSRNLNRKRDGEEVFITEQKENVVEEVVDATQVNTATITTEEITLAQALEALKTSKPKVKGIVFQEPGESTTTKSITISSQQSQDKGKGIIIEEPMKPMKKKDL